MAEKVQLPYTLQTIVGMVKNSGLPAIRSSSASVGASGRNPDNLAGSEGYPILEDSPMASIPHVATASDISRLLRKKSAQAADVITCFQDYIEQDWFSPKHAPVADVAAACIRQSRRPNMNCLNGQEADLRRFANNIGACRNGAVDMHELMTLIKSRVRLDLEQAAAAVVSAFVNEGRTDDAVLLLRELTGVLAVSHMAPPSAELGYTRRNTYARGAALGLAHLAASLHSWCARACVRAGVDAAAAIGAHPPRSKADLVTLLLRVRCARPGDKTRCLYIPAWMFEAAGVRPPPAHAEYLEGYQAELAAQRLALEGIKGRKFPEAAAGADSVVLSQHGFRVVQRRVIAQFAFWDPAAMLRRDVRALEDSVLFAGPKMDERLRQTEEVAEVAHWFFQYQRRLQPTVVSDDKWTKFLAKGEGKTLYQNNLRMRSTFEGVLRRMAGVGEIEPLSRGEDVLGLIDRTCLLMKEYVDVHGGGKKENLVFQRGVRGGGGRGPVDEYNVLCDVLRELTARARDEGIEKVPGPVYKFLAKDILMYFSSWGDDAFAQSREHGWEVWLTDRGLVPPPDKPPGKNVKLVMR